MNNAAYWACRFKNMEDAIKDQAYDYVKNAEKQFDYAIKDIDSQIRTWYQRLADNNGVSVSEARKMLNKSELKEFKWTVEEYIEKGRESGISGAWLKELENASAKVHISRLDALKLQLKQQAEALMQTRLQTTTQASEFAYTESYYHTAFEVQKGLGVGWSMQTLNTEALRKVLSRPWSADKLTFAARCWTDKEKLVQVIDRELTRMIATGDSPDKAINAVAKQLKTTKSNAGRVVMTESAYFSSAAQKDCFNELGVERYVIVTALDKDTCEICGDFDKEVFNMSEYVVGSTAPPFHPWCRCCTAPYFEDLEGIGERMARDPETDRTYKLSKDTTYRQWKQLQDDAHYQGYIDKMRKMSYNINTDKEQFDRYKRVLRDLTPQSFEEFQNIKVNDPDRYRILKRQYKILNPYKIDSGEISAKDLLRFDQKVIAEKRLNFTSKYKNSGNIAGAYIDGNFDDFYIAHSQINEVKKAHGYKGKEKLVLLKEQRRFTYIDVLKSNGETRSDTFYDTEAKLFENFADLYDAKPFKSITMLSERGMCDSCRGVMEQFKKAFPKVEINVVSNKRVEGNVWEHKWKNSGGRKK